MVIRSTPHAHTTFVDGKNTPLEMVEAAISKGFLSLGLSEHGGQSFDQIYGMSEENERAYIDAVMKLKAQYAGRIHLFLGCERDMYGTADPKKFEYTIGSKHYFLKDGHHFAGDGNYEDVLDGCDRLFGGDWYALSKGYFSEFADFIEREAPDIIGHFDIITKHNEGMRLFDENDRRYRMAGCEALERMSETGALLEVNTGAIARGYRTLPYPSLQFLKFWREKGGRVIVSSDCHDASKIDCGYDIAYALIEEAGYKSAWALGDERQLFTEYGLK